MTQTNNTGFLHAEGRHMADGQGRPIQLRGAALGNWMLLEGYMWGFMTSKCNRERLIEEAFRQLAGREYADAFFPRYREAFVTEGDIRRMSELGFNSVRVSFNAKHLLREGPGVHFLEEGFALLDRVIAWCKKYGLYAILDMHAAPGGQTGSNIDDGVDDVPRLFIDGENWDKALLLWEEIAKRYKDEPAVGGYDLLNEPLRPKRPGAPIEDLDYLIPSLIRFYDECASRIRAVDSHHMLSIEGAHWGRDTRVFDHLYDENMCIHFHTYWTMIDRALFAPYLALSEKLNVPLWLGETGENTPEWYTTLFPLLDEMGISWNFWQWKKGIRRNSNYVIRQPEGWQTAVEYVLGGPHPGYENARRMLEDWLTNCRFENCEEASDVTNAMLRRPGARIPAISYSNGERAALPCADAGELRYLPRFGAMPEIDKSHAHGDSNVRTDHPWLLYDLLLAQGERACYLLRPSGARTSVRIVCRALAPDTRLTLGCGDASRTVTPPQALRAQITDALALPAMDGDVMLRIYCESGSAAVAEVLFENADDSSRP